MIRRASIASFSSELQKIAEEVKRDGAGTKVFRGVLGGAVAPVLLNNIMAAAATDKVPRRPNPASTVRNVKNVAKHMGVKDFDIHHDITPGAAAGMSEALPKAKRGPSARRHFVNIPHGSREATIAHELGHVRNSQKLGLPYAVLQGLSRRATVPLSLGTGMYSAGKEDPTYTSGVVNAAVAAPMMGEELSANLQAVKHMSKRYGIRKGLSKSKHLAPAMGTYAAMGLSPLAITAIRKKLRAKKQEEQAKVAAARKLKKKVSGLETIDRNYFVQALEDAPKTPPRGPHPALNYEHSR